MRKAKRLVVRKTPKKLLQIIGVVWMDAVFSDKEEAPQPIPMFTVGFLVEDVEGYISLAHEIGMDGEFRGTTSVPRGMVKHIYKYGKRISLDLCR